MGTAAQFGHLSLRFTSPASSTHSVYTVKRRSVEVFQPFVHHTHFFFIICDISSFHPLLCLPLLFESFSCSYPTSLTRKCHFIIICRRTFSGKIFSIPIYLQLSAFFSILHLLKMKHSFSFYLETCPCCLSIPRCPLSLRCEGDLLTLWSKEYWPRVNMADGWLVCRVKNAGDCWDSSHLLFALTFALGCKIVRTYDVEM